MRVACLPCTYGTIKGLRLEDPLWEDTGARIGRRRADTDTLAVSPPGPHIGVKVTLARVK